MKKIEALQKTIYNLENDVYEYSWLSYETCNCGVLAKTILNNGNRLSDSGFLDSNVRKANVTTFASVAYCMTSNLPLPVVFKVLKESGFTYQDLLELENLSNSKVLSILGWESYLHGNGYMVAKDNKRSTKNNVIKYLKAWVSILKEQTPDAIQPTYPDLTKSLAILPIEETSDCKIKQLQTF